MKLGPATTDKKIKITSNKFDDGVMLANSDGIVIFSIYDQFGANRKLGFGRIVCKIYMFINNNLLPYKNCKQNQKISNTALAILL